MSNYVGYLECVICIIWRWYHWQPFSAHVSARRSEQGHMVGWAKRPETHCVLVEIKLNVKSLWISAAITKEIWARGMCFGDIMLLKVFKSDIYNLFFSNYHKFKASSWFRIIKRYKNLKLIFKEYMFMWIISINTLIIYIILRTPLFLP